MRNDAVDQGPERQRYVMMGASVALAASLAAVSMWVLTGYILPGDTPAVVRAGASAMWATIVAVIDRTIAVVLVGGGVVRRFFAYLPRVAFAAVAAFLVSEPLVVAAYDKEIRKNLDDTAIAMRVTWDEEARRDPRFIAYSDEVVKEDKVIEALNLEITTLNNQAAAEERGDGATGVPRCGRVCRGFKAERVKKEGERDAAQQRRAVALGSVAADQEQKDAERVAFVAEKERQFRSTDGIAARHDALDRYLATSPGANLVRWAAVVILVLADLMVVFFKLIGGRTSVEMREEQRLALLRRKLAHEMNAAEKRGPGDAEAKAEKDAEVDAEIEKMGRAERLRRARRSFERQARSFGDRSGRSGGSDTPRYAESGSDTPRYADSTPSARDTPRYADQTAESGTPGYEDDAPADPAEGIVVPGDASGPYELGREIGRGSYGQVFKARDRGADRDVAVKFMMVEDVASWRREVRNAATCQDPHIAPVLDTPSYGEDYLCVVYPYYKQGSLADARRASRRGRRQKISLGYALQVFEQLVHALDKAHHNNVVHRDIKPQNVLLDGGIVRVSDWGRARGLLDLSLSPALADWQWTAPEVFAATVAQETDPSDGLSDLYSAAAVLYWLITGAAPLRREMDADGLDLNNEGRGLAEKRQLVPARVDECYREIPAEFANLLARWLARDPAERTSVADPVEGCKEARLQLRAAISKYSQEMLNEIEVGGPWPTNPTPGEGLT